MQLLFTVTMVVVLAVWCVAIFFRSRFLLHMMQLEGYKNENYLKWVNQNKTKAYPKKLRMIFNVIAVATIALGAINSPYSLYIYSAIWLVGILISIQFKRETTKIDLVYTDRAKRLFLANGILNIVVLGVIVLIYWFTVTNVFNYIPLVMLFAGLLYYANTLTLTWANKIMIPIEKKINKKYFDQAKEKIRTFKRLKVVGITGSYGKTSVKFITSTILEDKFKTLKTPESYNTPMGVSKVINGELDDTYETFVVEMGARNIGDIKEMAELAGPTIGILTSVGPTHLETFKNIENIMKTKYELIDELPADGIAIFNYDNKYVKKLADKTFKEKILYGIQNINKVDIYAKDIEVSEKGSTFTLGYKDGDEMKVTTKLLGEHNISNILAGVAAGKALGMELADMAERIDKVEPVPHRLQLINPGTGITIIDDAFNSNPVSSKAALDVLSKFKEGRKVIITPGMIELGEDEDKENKQFGKNIAKVCDFAILVGKNRTKPIQEGIKSQGFPAESLFIVDSLDQATQVLQKLVRPKDVVLFENDLPDNYNE